MSAATTVRVANHRDLRIGANSVRVVGVVFYVAVLTWMTLMLAVGSRVGFTTAGTPAATPPIPARVIQIDTAPAAPAAPAPAPRPQPGMRLSLP